MHKLKRRIVSLLLVVAMVLPMIMVQAGAVTAGAGTITIDPDSGAVSGSIEVTGNLVGQTVTVAIMANFGYKYNTELGDGMSSDVQRMEQGLNPAEVSAKTVTDRTIFPSAVYTIMLENFAGTKTYDIGDMKPVYSAAITEAAIKSIVDDPDNKIEKVDLGAGGGYPYSIFIYTQDNKTIDIKSTELGGTPILSAIVPKAAGVDSITQGYTFNDPNFEATTGSLNVDFIVKGETTINVTAVQMTGNLASFGGTSVSGVAAGTYATGTELPIAFTVPSWDASGGTAYTGAIEITYYADANLTPDWEVDSNKRVLNIPVSIAMDNFAGLSASAVALSYVEGGSDTAEITITNKTPDDVAKITEIFPESSDTSKSTINAAVSETIADTATYTITAAAGKPVGAYGESITISYTSAAWADIEGAETQELTIPVTLTVTPAQVLEGKLTANPSSGTWTSVVEGGTVTGEKVFQIKNTGTAALTIDKIELTGAFSGSTVSGINTGSMDLTKVYAATVTPAGVDTTTTGTKTGALLITYDTDKTLSIGLSVEVTAAAKIDTAIGLDVSTAEYTGNDLMATAGAKVMAGVTDVTGKATAHWLNASGTTVTELKDAGVYTYTVTAIDSKYNMPDPATATFTITPKKLTEPTLSAQKASAVNGTDGSITIDNYSAYTNSETFEIGTDGTNYSAATVSSGGVISNLTGGTTYHVRAVPAPADTNHANSDAASIAVPNPTDGSVSVTLTKDTSPYTGQTVTLGSASGTSLSDTATSGTYVASGVTPGEYSIWVNSKDTGEKVTVTAGATATASIAYFTVTATAGTGALTAQVDSAGTAVVQSGKTAALTATAKPGYGDTTVTWTLNPTTPSSVSGATITVSGTVEATASYAANELTFAPKTLTAGTYKTAYTANVTTATNGSGNYAYTLVGTAGTEYPSWLNLSTAGAFSGTPDALADATTFVVKVDDATTGATKTATYTLTIGQATPTVTTPPVYKTGPHWTGDSITVAWSNTPIVDGVSGDNGLAGAWTLTDTNKNLLKGTNSYEFTFTPTDTGYEAVTSSVSIKADDKTYTIAADPTTLTFTTAKAGYTPQAKTFTVKNTGNQDADALTYSALTNFALSGTVGTLTAGGTSSAITVKPNSNLAVGVYKETLTITNTTDGKTTIATVTLSFEVEAADKPTLSGGSITAKTGSEKTAADVKFTTDTAGTYYYVAQTSGAAPTAAEIKAASGGIHGSGRAEAGAGNGAIAITGLTADNTYQVYIIVDNAGTLSDVMTLTHKTWYDATITIQKDGVTSAAPDTLTLVGGTNPSVGGNGGNHTAVLDQEVTYKLKVGNVEVATITHAALTTTVEYFTLTVKDGKGSQNAAITGGNAVFLKGTTATVSASPATGYTGDATWTLSDSSTSVVTDNSITVNDKVTATASFAPRAITYNPGSLTFTIDTSAVNETVGTAEATGANPTDFTYAVKSGALPTELTLVGTTGAITGTPTAATAAAGVEVTITATDTVTKETKDAVWTFIVNKTALPALTWTTKTDASTVGGSEGAVTFDNFANDDSGSHILEKDAKAIIAVKSKPNNAPDPTIDQVTGAVTGLVAGNYVFYVVAGADGSYNDSADSATLTIVDGKEYTGKVNVQVDDAVTNLSGVTVTFVGKNGASVAATGNTDGLYTANSVLNTDNDPYTVHVSVNRNGAPKDITTGATVNGSAGTVTAADTVKLYTVNFTAGVARSNTYENAEFATKVAGVLSAKIGTDPILNTELAYTGETATFTVTDSETNKGEYTLDWTAVLTGSINDSTLKYTAPTAAVTAALVQKLYTVSGTVTGEGELGSIRATATGVDETDSTAPFGFSLPKGTYSFEAAASGENVVTGNPVPGISITADNSNAYTFNVDGPKYTMTALDTNGNDATETVTVTYGYSQPAAITVNVTNDGNRKLFDLTVEGSNAAFDVSAIPANTDLAAEGGTIEVTITPKAGQSATTHTLNLTFKGQKTDGGTDNSFTASYKAELAVGKFDLSGETISISGTSPYKVGTALTATHAANAGLKPTDYQVKWYRADDAAGAANPEDTGETGLTYTIVAADVGKHLFAKVESASANTENEKMSNVLGAVNYADYTGIVNIKEGTTAITAAGGYTVEFRPSDGAGTTVNGTFKNGHFESATMLDSTESGYDVWVKNVANANGTLMASGKSVSPTGVSAEVVYYPVTFTADATITNTNDAVPDALKQGDVTLTAALTTGSVAVENDDCVLAGQGVTFTADGYAVDTHDYAPAWTTATGGSGNSANTATLTYGEAKATVALALTQRTYSVTGNVEKGVTKVTATGASGTFSVDVANAGGAAKAVTITGLPSDTYTISVAEADLDEAVLDTGNSLYDSNFKVDSANISADGFNILTLTSTYTVSFTWDAASDSYTYGYEASSVNERTLTIKNTGNSDITNFVVATSDNTNFTYDTTALTALGGTLKASGDVDGKDKVEIKVKLNTGRDYKAAAYTTDFTVTADKLDNKDGAEKTTYSATVAKKDITSAAITGVATPENGVIDASDLAGVPTGSSGVLTWSPALVDNKFAPGTVYTATVVLTPDENHTYPDSATGTINGGGSGTATDGVLTLKRTFKPTVPTLGASLAATAFDKATATFTVGQQASGATYEIKYLITDGAAPTAEDQLTGTLSSDTTANAIDLLPNKAYTVYALARVTVDGQTSDATAITASTADTTYYKVVTAYTGHNEGGDSAPTITPATTVNSSVKGGATLAINAVATEDYWKFDEWTAPAGTVPAKGTANGNFTAPAATGDGTNGTITLTAAFVGADLTVTSNYAITGTYGAAYTGTAPTVTGGSGDYTYTRIDPVTRAATNDLPAGLKLNADGTITGKPEETGTFTFAVKVKDDVTGKTANTANVTLTVSAATPTLTTGYAAGTYYNGNPLEQTILQGNSTATAQVLTSGTGDTAVWEAKTIAGTWSFTDSKTTYGGSENAATGTYNYTVKFVPTDATYAETTGAVNIDSIKKTYGVTLVLTSTTPDPFTKDYGTLDGTEVATLTATNKGNQNNPMSYAISGTDAGKFTLSKTSSGALDSNGTDTVTLTVNDTALAEGSYTVTLTATDSKGNKAVVDVTFVVAPAEITTAGVADLAAPVKGSEPDDVVAETGPDTANFTTAVKWTDKDGNEIKKPATYAAGSEYTVEVTLTADGNHTFTNDGTYTITNANVTPTVKVNDAGTPANTVVLTYKYPATAAGAVTVAAEALGNISNAETIRITKLEAVSSVAVDFYYVVTTNSTPPTAEQVMKATAPDMVAGASGSKKNSTSNGTKAAWTGDERISDNIAAGTPYYVYAIAVPAGAIEASGTVGNKSLTTYYEVTMAAGANGSVSPAAATVLHIEPLKSTSISATADPGYKFNGWTSAGGNFGDASKPSTTFTPTANTTVTAAFSGISDLKVTAGSATGGNEVGDNYDDAPNKPNDINVFPGGELTNQGGGATGTLGYKVVAEGGTFGDIEIDTFTVDFTADTLAAGSATAFTVHPAAGLTTDGSRPKTYTATIWIYDTTHDTARDPITVSITIVDSKGLIVNPADYEYDLKAGVNNPEWKIDVAEGEFNTHVSLKNGAATLSLGTDYTYTATDKKGVLVISKTYLDNLRTTNNPAEGDAATLTLTMKTTGISTATKALTIHYKDTTPYLTGVSIAPNADIRENSVLTATVNASNLTAPTAGQVTYQWYKTGSDMAHGTKIAGATAATYTVKATDVGAKFYVEVEGNGQDFKKTKVMSTLTESGKYTVTLVVSPVGGGAVSPITSYVTPGESITILAGQASGYDFVNWTVTEGTGTLDNANANSTTYTPNSTSTVTANFKLLPTLTIAGSPYDATAGTGTLPSLTYTKNAGAYSKAIIKGPGLDRDMLASDFTANALPTAAGGTYELARTFVNGLSAGAYTITFVDGTAAYSRSVILNVRRSTQALTSVAISGTVKLGQTLTATVAPGIATANYEWYFNSTPSNTGGTKITGADATTYALPADGVVNGGAANLSGMYIYVKAIGTINYTGTVVSPVTVKLDVAKYTVTVEADGPGTIKANNSEWKATETINDAPYNVSIPIQANANDSYLFAGWTVTGGTGVFGDANLADTTFTPTGGNVTVKAKFVAKQIDSMTVTGIDVPQKGGTPDPDCNLSGTHDYTYGAVTWNPGDLVDGKFKPSTSATATITVTPATGIVLKPDATITVTVPGASNATVVDNRDNTWTITITYPPTGSDGSGGGGGGGGGGGETTAFTVTYDLRDLGTTKDKTTESVVSGKKPKDVPTVTANKGLTFLGWSLKNPDKETVTKKDIKNPKSETITADTVFYAVYDGHIIGEHEHFIKGLPDGNFGPTQDITRAEVATIIARACLGGFVEGAPSNSSYPDVPGHWAQSAIDFCTSKGIFLGYDDGMFHPDTPITRQEFAAVFARMAGLKKSGDMPFNDISTAHEWALDGIYTAYVNGWVVGYADGTFKPLNNIARSEAVKIVDAYLGRGVNEAGVKDVLKDVKQWPDVPETYWAYYEIMEASNDHTYHYADEKAPPEVWTKAYIEKASWGE